MQIVRNKHLGKTKRSIVSAQPNFSPNFAPHPFDGLDPINAKLQFIEEKLLRYERESFRRVWTEICKLYQHDVAQIWALLQMDATTGARLLLNQENIAAHFVGDALVVWKCSNVTVLHIHWNYKVLNECYDLVPVTTTHGLMFKSPGSNELLRHANRVNCHYVHAGIYNEKGTWRSITGPVSVHEFPLVLNWKNNWNITHFKSPPIFKDQLLLKSSFSIQQLRQQMAKTELLNYQMQRLINFSSQFATDPDTIKEIPTGIGTGIGNVFNGIGSGIEHVLEGGGHLIHDVSDSVSDLLKGPFQIIVNIAVMLLVLGLTGLVGYCIYTYVRQRSKRKTHLRSGKPDNAISKSAENIELGEAMLGLASAQPRQSPSPRRKGSKILGPLIACLGVLSLKGPQVEGLVNSQPQFC